MSDNLGSFLCGCCDMAFPPRFWPRAGRYDCYWCPKCGSWLEESCHDPTCMFCSTRPANAFVAGKSAEKGLRYLDESILDSALYSQRDRRRLSDNFRGAWA